MFGPLQDGMVIASAGLPDLLRYTILDAYRHCIFDVLNEPRCVIKRSNAISDLVWRNYSPPQHSWYNSFIFQLLFLELYSIRLTSLQTYPIVDNFAI